MAVAQVFPEYWDIGKSKGGFMSFGLLPYGPELNSRRLFASGVIFDGKVEDVNFNAITEDVRYSKYSSESGLRIKDGHLKPDPEKHNAYSWIKAPRYNGSMIEVGPTARVLVDYHRGNNTQLKSLVDSFAKKAGISIGQINSVLGRHLCRAISAVVIADFLLDETERIDHGAPSMADYELPQSGEGFGTTEASRGALLHYIRIENKVIEKYECVVPTTWNCSPRDDKGQPGALESALIGTKVKTPEEQIEANRIIRSFDPCIACAVH